MNLKEQTAEKHKEAESHPFIKSIFDNESIEIILFNIPISILTTNPITSNISP